MGGSGCVDSDSWFLIPHCSPSPSLLLPASPRRMMCGQAARMVGGWARPGALGGWWECILLLSLKGELSYSTQTATCNYPSLPRFILPVSYLPAATAAAGGCIETGSNTWRWIVKEKGRRVQTRTVWLGSFTGGMHEKYWSSNLSQLLGSSLSLFVSLSTYFSLMSAPSTHPWLCLCLRGSSFTKRYKRRKKRFIERKSDGKCRPWRDSSVR